MAGGFCSLYKDWSRSGKRKAEARGVPLESRRGMKGPGVDGKTAAEETWKGKVGRVLVVNYERGPLSLYPGPTGERAKIGWCISLW